MCWVKFELNVAFYESRHIDQKDSVGYKPSTLHSWSEINRMGNILSTKGIEEVSRVVQSIQSWNVHAEKFITSHIAIGIHQKLVTDIR